MLISCCCVFFDLSGLISIQTFHHRVLLSQPSSSTSLQPRSCFSTPPLACLTPSFSTPQWSCCFFTTAASRVSSELLVNDAAQSCFLRPFWKPQVQLLEHCKPHRTLPTLCSLGADALTVKQSQLCLQRGCDTYFLTCVTAPSQPGAHSLTSL